jgi:uncharacterized membrane protein YvbJ
MTPEICPNCGAEVPRNAKACPECGSDETTGWSDEAQTGNLDLPEEEFDYDKFVDREFGGKKPVPHGIHWFWWVVAVLLVGLFVAFWLRR